MKEMSSQLRTGKDMLFSLISFNYSSAIGFFNEIYFSSTPRHLTSPPYRAREALPDPLLASLESSSLLNIFPKRLLRAAARHEKPEAEEAIPEADGKLFSDYILK